MNDNSVYILEFDKNHSINICNEQIIISDLEGKIDFNSNQFEIYGKGMLFGVGLAVRIIVKKNHIIGFMESTNKIKLKEILQNVWSGYKNIDTDVNIETFSLYGKQCFSDEKNEENESVFMLKTHVSVSNIFESFLKLDLSKINKNLNIHIIPKTFIIKSSKSSKFPINILFEINNKMKDESKTELNSNKNDTKTMIDSSEIEKALEFNLSNEKMRTQLNKSSFFIGFEIELNLEPYFIQSSVLFVISTSNVNNKKQFYLELSDIKINEEIQIKSCSAQIKSEKNVQINGECIFCDYNLSANILICKQKINGKLIMNKEQ
eukprot:498320_1